jgi:2,3-bisphosphoglycerate-dependent phosphoglycerate mutase
MKNFIFIFLLVLLGQQNVIAQKTVKVWVVRHAEKLTVDPKDRDPELSEEGKLRAEALMKELKGEGIDSIFATNYKRTKLTGFPLADKIGIAIKTYDPAKIKELAKEWAVNAKGKNLLIVGHSNTVLEIIEAFGGVKPVKELTDDDYDYLFELTIKDKKVDIKTSRYGAEHHTKDNKADTKTKM